MRSFRRLLLVLNCLFLLLLACWMSISPHAAMVSGQDAQVWTRAAVLGYRHIHSTDNVSALRELQLSPDACSWWYDPYITSQYDQRVVGWYWSGFGRSFYGTADTSYDRDEFKLDEFEWGFDYLGLRANTEKFGIWPRRSATTQSSTISQMTSIEAPLRTGTSYHVSIPLWLPLFLLSIAPVRRLLAMRRGLRRLRQGLCERCAYDLRQATSDRCPECGTPHAFAR